MKQNLIAFLHAFLPLLAAGLFFAFIADAPNLFGPSERAPTSFSDLEKSFAWRIRAVGGEEAYAEFKRERRSGDPNAAHTAAHAFGAALFDVLGDEGIRTCQASFNYGCYHGFFLSLVAAEGLGAVPQLDAVCQASESTIIGPCEHGIGHGILEYLGHKRLPEALTACLGTKRVDRVGGCPSGVFMEYNNPRSDDAEGGTRPRPLLDPTQPYLPCPNIDAEFRPSCYNALPAWWHQVLSDDFRRLGDLCHAVQDKADRSACFEGIAATAVNSWPQSLERALEACRMVPLSEEKSLCETRVTGLMAAEQ